ncbi:hypothetical protein ONR57_22975 [Hoyosella sp. YIM 151337]|uniref:hypothetical protein n=1 Tax=Hoyosella sp. YIM 151337 TaxID=2992742 RepID=UPI00223669E3|nr:hypothetical protein [Hoyosella sp. YIM 151337]MCW4356174.1 hypothetical protein [Hoyosella sp. YIM 151337]
MTGSDTSLFPDCVLPGCTRPVTQFGDACTACVTAFGPMLRPDGTPVTEAEIRDRDSTTRAIYAYRAMIAATQLRKRTP